MLSADLKDSFFAFVRMGIRHSTCSHSTIDSWIQMKELAEEQGLSAIVLDGIDASKNSLNKEANPFPLQMKLEWIGEVLHNYESRYKQYRDALASLASFYNQHGFKMMVLKGYGLCLNYPNPSHRPCGDIDIWLFGQQKEADEALRKAQGAQFKIDTAHHHHTVFEWKGFSVENHYDFLNVHHHKSNVEMEKILKDLGQDDSHYVEIEGEKVYLPSANHHALFLLRHSMSNFASTGIKMRQLLDWAFLAEKQGSEIDWNWLNNMIEHFGMQPLYQVFNAICVEDLGFDAKIFHGVQFDPKEKERVLNDILAPEFSKKENGGFFRRSFFKYHRWKSNAWKHELCFSDSLWSAFWSGVKSHVRKPSSI